MSDKPDPFYIVVRTAGPSDYPQPNDFVRHETYESALEEAKRLATWNPQIEFTVMMALARCRRRPDVDVEVFEQSEVPF